MTHEEVLNHQPIRINTLYGMQNVSPCYVLSGYNVVNTVTGHVKTINRMISHHQKYPYVTLETTDNTHNKKILLHRLLALAYIHNGPIDIVEHLDDNADNYRIDNLSISNHSINGKHAFQNGHGNRTERIFQLTTIADEKYVGTVKELSTLTGIPRQTIYSRYYKSTPGKIIKEVTLLTGQQTIEKETGRIRDLTDH